MPSPATIVRADFLAAIAGSEPDDTAELVDYAAERRWWPELVAAVQYETWLAPDVVRRLPRKHRTALYRWASANGTRTAAAVDIIVAALGAGDGDQAAHIVASQPAAVHHGEIIDVLSEQVRAGDTSAALACCRAGVSPFPLSALDPTYVPSGYFDAQRLWITTLLADQSPSPAARRRRLLLIPQAAAEAGVLSVAGGRAHHRGTPPTSLHRAATAPHMGGLLVDHEPLIWMATEAIHQGAAMRDRRFAAAMKRTAAAHAGITGDLRVLAALGAGASTSGEN